MTPRSTKAAAQKKHDLFYVLTANHKQLHIHTDAVPDRPGEILCTRSAKEVWPPNNFDLVQLPICQKCQSIFDTWELTNLP